MVAHTLSSACTPLRLVLDEASAVGQPMGRAGGGGAGVPLHAPLTTRPNRYLFHDRQQHAILAARCDSSFLSFLLKEISAAFGHACGDVLQLAARLQGILRESDTVARLGGDEFGLLLPATIAMGATWVADKLLMADLTRWLQESHWAAAT
jgi:diguanylate cyclase (GGDEF)-like protein